jgi:hypothetical protein
MRGLCSGTALGVALVLAMCGASFYMWSLKDEAARELVAKHEPWPSAAGVEPPVLLVVRLKPNKQRTKVHFDRVVDASGQGCDSAWLAGLPQQHVLHDNTSDLLLPCRPTWSECLHQYSPTNG